MMVPVGRLVLLRSVPKQRARAGAELAHDSRADRPDGRAAARRLHHHVFQLALDFPDQSADRHARHGARAEVHSEHSRRGAAATRLAGVRARRRRARRGDVRILGARSASVPDGSRGGRAVRRRRRSRWLHAARETPSATAAGSGSVSLEHLSRGRLGWVAVPDRHRRVAVPVAVDAAARVRFEPSTVGPVDVRVGRRRDLHEDARGRDPAAGRLSPRAAVECARGFGDAVRVRPVPARARPTS